ncbi:EAL domain-containing protein [Aquibium sp. A9E412]|uniref:putative bifunctional diguanylate cyclase/phosphodiesterase n=1 Tax=Aquibium sp. A9E412 TaxID=2976767 RepID=UPI0025B24527|nr:EAL domain-containing protein [Aquibium sp. A9E412]MDN2565009.1 EAL domain-containing protein [Aquibium sp. A9E412]
MQEYLAALWSMGASQEWLVTANFILSVLLALWMLRYRQLYLSARAEQENARGLIDNLTEGIYRSSLDGRQLSANPALVRLNGYDSEAELLASVKDIAREWYVEPDRRAVFRDILMREGKVENFVSEIYRHKTRERIWVSESARLVCDHKTGRPLFYEGSVREITEMVERLHLEEMFQKLTTQLPGGLFQIYRRKGGRYSVPYASSGFRRMIGLAPDAMFPRPDQVIAGIHEEDRQRYMETMRHSGMALTRWECEFRIQPPGGTEKWLRVNAMPEATADGILWHGYVSDISMRKTQEVEITKLAFYDPLTALPNRRLFLDRINAAAERCRTHGGHGALMFIDLDNFKTLNDAMGHDVGDRFLVQVAERLRACVGEDGMVARIGGDEFVIVLEQLGGEHAIAVRNAIVVANRALSVLRRPFQLGRLEHTSSASVGVVVFDGVETQPDEIVKHADLAMYQAKSAGRNGVALFDRAAFAAETERFRLLAELREAMAAGNVGLHFQPQVDEMGHVTGAEVLARWDHPERGVLAAESFVPLAEQFGLAADLCRFVLKQAMATLVGWRDDPRMAGLRLAVNIGVPSIVGDDLADFLGTLLKQSAVDPARLTLELGRQVMAKDQPLIARRMNELKALGVRLCLDDFGTGHSSLSDLKSLPFDELKIDGTFVADIEGSDTDRALVQTMLTMARTLRITSVAEHVETIQQAAFLRAFGCDSFQGWYFSPPLSADDLAAFVAEHNPAPPVQLADFRRNA